MALRKNNRMYELFGRNDAHECRTCNNLYGEPGGYYKCLIYGRTASEASDWRLSYKACGLYNKDYKGDIPVINLNRGGKRGEDIQCEGQMSLF